MKSTLFSNECLHVKGNEPSNPYFHHCQLNHVPSFISAVKRLMREAKELSEATSDYYAQPLSDNLFEWHFTVGSSRFVKIVVM